MRAKVWDFGYEAPSAKIRESKPHVLGGIYL